MYFFLIPFLFKKIFHKTMVWEMSSSEKTIYLTFDDGPEPSVTPEILEILYGYNAKATFFCVGNNAKNNPDIFEMLVKSGHSVGNHTYNHLNGWNTETEKYLEDVEKCNKIVKSNLFRPPYGKLKLSQLRKLKNNYSIIMWSLICGDFDKNVSKEKCLEILLKNTRSGSIVVLHDSLKAKEKVLYALPIFLEHFTKLGYTFNTV
ncbi:MAG: polysaccharide deacetylase family protein [Bacteroidetes bacterium]|nr:polysaccharide deacetylase family protein [Bacteroidota bacterium]